MCNCKFCDIISGKKEDYKLWEDENFSLILDIKPANPGHSMLIPKKHIDDVFKMADEEYSELFRVIKKLSEPIKRAFGAKRIGVAIVGFNVDHAHVHLVPLHKKGEMFEGSQFYDASKEELDDSFTRIRNELGEK